MHFNHIGISSDHTGRELKSFIGEYLNMLKVQVTDLGVSPNVEKSVDYPDYAAIAAQEVSNQKVDGAIAICGTGIGMSIAANKFPGVRATCIWDEYSCRMSRKHNDSNILCIGSRVLNQHRVVDLVKIWLETPFDGERHLNRIEKIRQIERRQHMNP